MHDLRWIRENPDAFDRGLERRGLPPCAEQVLALDREWRALQTAAEETRAMRNRLSREIGAAKIATIGPATAQRVKDFHLHVDLQPDEFVAEAVVKEFEKGGGVENLRILIARAERARDLLPKKLSGMGAIVDEAFAYQTVPETRDVTGAHHRFSTEGADLITFTSSSTVENFLDLKLPWPPGMKVASIGPITSATLRERGVSVDVEAKRHDVAGLIEAIRKFYGA